MKNYRKKPVVIQAMTFDELLEYGRTCDTSTVVNGILWDFYLNTYRVMYSPVDDIFIINTLEGDHTMTMMDMLIIGIQGEIYPCKIDIFKATYEEV